MIPLDRYPKEITLRDGIRVTLRPMVEADVGPLWDFFQGIPDDDKMFFREDVTRRDVVEEWARQLDYARTLPILAFEGKRVVGDATLHRNTTGWKQRVGIVRIQVALDYRHRGLGTAMIREIRHVGEKASLRYLMAEVIEEQGAAIRAFEAMGFERAAVYRSFVNDQKGRMHNLAVLLYPMSVRGEEDFF